MKKILCVLCCVFLSFTCFGFSLSTPTNYVDNTIFSHVVVNDGSSVTETFALNLQKTNGIDETTQNIILARYQTILSQLRLEYEQKIQTEADTNKKDKLENIVGIVKKDQDLIYMKITFKNLETWQYFCEDLPSTQNNLIFVKKIQTEGRVASVSNLSFDKMYTADYLKIVTFSILNSNVPSWHDDQAYLYSYTYVTKYRRYHSSSDAILKINNLYYHQWLMDKNPQISFWIIAPVYVWWYVVGIGCGILVGLAIFLIAHFKNKKSKKSNDIKSILEI